MGGGARALQVLRWLLAPVLLLLGKRRRRLRDLEALQYHGLDQDHRSAQDAGKVSLLYQLSEAQRADRMEGSMALGRGNDLAAKMFNEFVDEQSDQLVQFFGDFLLGVLKDPDAPASTHRAIERNFALVWPDIRDQLKWDLAGSLQILDNESTFFRTLRLRHWAASPPPLFPWCHGRCTWPQPFTYFRARLRYLLFPAERSPPDIVIWAWMVLNLTSAGETCNWALLLYFIIIDKSDEAQLVTFIIFNKLCHFVAFGLIPAVQTLFAYFDCTLLDVGSEHPCYDTTTSSPTSAAFEGLRILLAWLAFYLLRCHSKGGDGQVARLELERLDLARSCSSAAAIQKIACGPDGAPPLPGRRGGTMLAFLMVYDVLVLMASAIVGFAIFARRYNQVDCSVVDCSMFVDWPETSFFHRISIHWQGFNEELPNWLYDQRFWATLDFVQTCYSVLLLPFVILALPPCKAFLTHARRTNYDRRGNLCWALSDDQKKERKSLLHVMHVEEAAAAKMQAASRGAAARSKLRSRTTV